MTGLKNCCLRQLDANTPGTQFVAWLLQVMIAVDEALRRLEISAQERNAILEAFRYADARNAAALASAIKAAQQEAAQQAQEAASAQTQQAVPLPTSKPLTR